MFIFTVENINSIQDAVYSLDGMKDKHAEKIEYSKTKGLFKDFNYSKYFQEKPPKNTSMTTYQELQWLKDLPEDKEFVEKHDDIPSVFEEICKENNVEFPKELVNELLDSSAGFILELKWKYNRPRPFQLAKYYDIDLGGNVLDSMKTPSYPSGHSAQGFLIGKMLQTKLPITTDAFLQAAKKISYSRNIARAHYPSDSRMGEELGNAMYSYLKEKI